MTRSRSPQQILFAMILLKKLVLVLKNVLRNAQAADILQGYLVVGLLKSLKGAFNEVTFFPKFLFEAFPMA